MSAKPSPQPRLGAQPTSSKGSSCPLLTTPAHSSLPLPSLRQCRCAFGHYKFISTFHSLKYMELHYMYSFFFFCLVSFSLSIIILRFIHALAWINSSLPFTPEQFLHREGFAAMTLPFHLLMSIWVVSTFCLLPSPLLGTFICKSLNRHYFSFSSWVNI